MAGDTSDQADTWGDDPEALLDELDGGPDAGTDADDGQDGAAETEDGSESAQGAAQGAADGDLTGGERTVPVKALAAIRGENAELKARLAQLQADLAAGATGGGGSGDAQQDRAGAGSAWATERADLEREAAEAETDGDTALAKTLRAQIGAGDRLERMEAALAMQSQAAARSDELERDAAFAANPLMQAWAADQQRPGWNRAAVATHAELIASDPGYVRMSWAERFDHIANLVEAHMGPSPHRAAAQSAPGRRTARRAAAEDLPLSSSEIEGGHARDPDPRSVGDLEHMPAGDRNAALVALADRDPEALLHFLDGAPFGALNSPRGRKG